MLRIKENRQKVSPFCLLSILSYPGLPSTVSHTLTVTLKASALGLSAGVRMSARDTDVACAALFLTVELTLGRLTGNICLLCRLSHLVCGTAASLGREAAAAGLGRHLCLHTLDLNVLSSTTVVLIVRTVYNITIQFCHHTYLLKNLISAGLFKHPASSITLLYGF